MSGQFGLACQTCDGTGEIVIGQTAGTYWSPPEDSLGVCPVCEGRAWVGEKRFLEKFRGEFPTHDEAVQVYLDRIDYQKQGGW